MISLDEADGVIDAIRADPKDASRGLVRMAVGDLDGAIARHLWVRGHGRRRIVGSDLSVAG